MPCRRDPVLVDEGAPAAVGGGETEEGRAANGHLKNITQPYIIRFFIWYIQNEVLVTTKTHSTDVFAMQKSGVQN